MIFDLGVSNLQLTKKNRGFSFKLNGPLDMRMSKEGINAFEVINNYSAKTLSDIFYNFGDEVYSRRIARNIIKFREITPITSTTELAEIIRKAIPGKKKKIDKEAMASPMMRIPRMDVRVARDLLDVGIREFYELQGRSADSIWEEIKRKKPETPKWTLPYLRMAVYFCEEENPDPKKLHPQNWSK